MDHSSGKTVTLQALAPHGNEVVTYDRLNLALYASLLDAADQGREWLEVAANVMQIDVAAPGAEACWRSHVDRARWIVGEGLAGAIIAFAASPVSQSTR